MANKISIRIATASDNSVVTATLLDPKGQPVQIQKTNPETGKTKTVDLAGSSILRGRTAEEDKNQPPRVVAIRRLVRKIQAMPQLFAMFGWQEGEAFDPTYTETAIAPAKKTAIVRLIGFDTGFETSSDGPVEGHITAANQATGKDCGLVTVSSNKPVYNNVAEQAVSAVAAIHADLLEQSLDSSGLTTMVNSVMESGTVGEKAKGYFRQDGDSRSEGSKSDVANPMILPTVHRPASTADSLNKRKGVAGLRTTEADCSVPGTFAMQKTAAKGRSFVKKESAFKDTDPRIGLYMNVFVRNPALTLGKELAERMAADQKAYNELRAEKKVELASQGLSISWDKRKGQAVQGLCRGIANIVARAELGLDFGSLAPDASEADRVVRTWVDSTIAKCAAVGLTVKVQNGQVLINDNPVTWHKAVIAAELELRAAVNG
jgi:hypothetical protein